MDEQFTLAMVDLQRQQAQAQLRACNEVTAPYGLVLKDEQVHALVQRRFAALKETGRMEFGQGILRALATTFCTSPFIAPEDWQDVLAELQDTFYYFKNESEERIPDDDLIAIMKAQFDGVCQGSLDYLSGTTLEELCRHTRYDRSWDGR